MRFFCVIILGCLVCSCWPQEAFDPASLSRMIEGGNMGAPRRILEKRIEAAPGDGVAWRLLGRLYEMTGPSALSASCYVRAARLRPKDIPSIQGLGRLLSTYPPDWLEEESLESLPARTTRGDITIPASGQGKPSVRRFIQILPILPVAEAQDLRLKRSYPFLAYGYAFDEAENRWERKLTIRWASERHAEIASHILDLLLRLHAVVKERLGREPVFGREGRITVWVSPDGEAGGEQWKDNLYLYAVDAPRPAGEWLRQIAHEYGHHTLPAAEGFTEPEGWASGFLGERLFVRWLAPASPRGAFWPGDAEAEGYLQAAAGPPVRLFHQHGPYSALMRGQNKASMDAYLGLVLVAEACYGPRILRQAFDRQKGTAPRRFAAALGQAIEAAGVRSVHLPLSLAFKERTTGPETYSYRLYLPKGRYRLSSGGRAARGAFAVNGGKPVPWNQPAFVGPGWHRIAVRIIQGSPSDLTLIRS
ncbi:MAG: hypothetical protein IT210_05530 [Armatimonadetes bacterium]|nr:hypothetical protein [Armatimonadota bacterium]